MREGASRAYCIIKQAYRTPIRKENLQHSAEMLGLPIPPPLAPRYNITPSQLVACVRTNSDTLDREWVELQWDLVPSWAKDPSICHKLINARGKIGLESH